MFAAEDIAPGSLIWCRKPNLDRLLSPTDIADLPALHRDCAERYDYPHPHGPSVTIIANTTKANASATPVGPSAPPVTASTMTAPGPISTRKKVPTASVGRAGEERRSRCGPSFGAPGPKVLGELRRQAGHSLFDQALRNAS